MRDEDTVYVARRKDGGSTTQACGWTGTLRLKRSKVGRNRNNGVTLRCESQHIGVWRVRVDVRGDFTSG